MTPPTKLSWMLLRRLANLVVLQRPRWFDTYHLSDKMAAVTNWKNPAMSPGTKWFFAVWRRPATVGVFVFWGSGEKQFTCRTDC